MVVAKGLPAPMVPAVPCVDLSGNRSRVSQLIVEACEEYGFFKVANHGVSSDVLAKMEAAAAGFFSLPTSDKQHAGPPTPLGYGIRTIGFNGDAGELEYLLLHANRRLPKSGCCMEQMELRCVVKEYVGAVKELACEILDMLAEGLGIRDSKAFSSLIRDKDSDSLLRLNHYPAGSTNTNSTDTASDHQREQQQHIKRAGFGEHTDPQILALLQSNHVPGLEILSRWPRAGGGLVWTPVPPDPTTFCVNVGDALQAMTNGKLVSVRHRVMVNPLQSRLSIIYFAGPSLNTRISPLPEMVTGQSPCLYRPFTWGEYKKTMYALRLGHDRLQLFLLHADHDEDKPDAEYNLGLKLCM